MTEAGGEQTRRASMGVKALPAHSLHPPSLGLLPACAAPSTPPPAPGASPSGAHIKPTYASVRKAALQP